MIATRELDPQRHHDAGDIASAEHDVTAHQRDQYVDRLAFTLRGLPYLPFPTFSHPFDNRQREVLFVLEKVIEGASGVSGLTGHAFEDDIAVSVMGKPSSRCLEQRSARPCSALGLRPPAG
jgi:hypothetical protein